MEEGPCPLWRWVRYQVPRCPLLAMMGAELLQPWRGDGRLLDLKLLCGSLRLLAGAHAGTAGFHLTACGGRRQLQRLFGQFLMLR